MTADASPSTVDNVLAQIRPAVRDRSEYVVDTPSGIDVKVNQNESPFDLPDALKEELLSAFEQVEFNRYPTEQPDRLRHALAEYDGVDPESIIVGNGSNEITYTFGLALLDPGVPVVLPRPMFSLYDKVVRLYGADLTSIPPREDFSFDTEALLEAVVETEAAMTVLTTPNNPTGLAMTVEEIERIVTASPGFVVVDEAYVEFNPEGTVVDLLDHHPNLIILRTLSKGFGLAGMRLGYLMAHPDVVRELMKARLPFMVDRFAEQTALAVLQHPSLIDERIRRIQSSVDDVTEALQAMDGVEAVPSQANFVIFTTPAPADTLQDRLTDQGVLVRNMGGYPELEGYLRVSAGTEAENNAFLGALERSLRTEGVYGTTSEERPL
ncbi:MAG: histidinol-phosphate transaminase [Bacteroidetes bacterium SW_11_64_17]|nr:MAG: histidinol-phosphate transaminase [Bacteroidetes bacterium SW_11_64_17]